MTLALTLSSVQHVREYLAVIAARPQELPAQIEALRQNMAAAQAAHRAAQEEHQVRIKECEAARLALQQARDLAYASLLPYAEPTFGREKPEIGLRGSESDPEHKNYNPSKVAAWHEYQRASTALQAAPLYPSGTYVKAAGDKVQQVQRELNLANDRCSALESKLSMALNRLPSDLQSASQELLRLISEVQVERLMVPEAPVCATDAEEAGVIRGELPWACSCKGYPTVQLELGGTAIRLELDDEVRHDLCHLRSRFDAEALYGAVPGKHSRHRLHSLKPWPRSPISAAAQRKCITDSPSYLGALNGWLMVGPPGTSKTTYAAAAVIDWLTFRMCETGKLSIESFSTDLNYWRIKVPKWSRDMEAWEFRDFKSDVSEPEVTTDKLESVTRNTELRPILWLEELDKFRPTDHRLRNLYSLIDAVYEAGGVVIATANERPDDLERQIGEAIYRRLSGKNDDPETYLVWDLYKAPKASTK